MKTYANCKELIADYPNGVGRRGAKDLTKGQPKKVQPAFEVNDALYNANTGRDADSDGIACEKN